eukprot:CAMPEP_0119269954 /NCGR_PEP_ID=MMETSP1329-20130426/7143_1 /TAXON_ID=114041 /ORGANISM="Genus nov. species nov., Strain RCC1024" /LENGTH=790 /DNA_ID=CAMNT_0007269957 /DNA_START=145 /DNA_END=2514 /DNA_ORIENTATION=+
MCRAPAVDVENATLEDKTPSPRGARLTFVAICVLDLAVTTALSLYKPPSALNACGSEAFALGSTTWDLVAIAALRCALYGVVARRATSEELVDKCEDRLSHLCLAQLVYALSKGIGRALGARADCDDVTEAFDGACGAFAVLAYAGPWALGRWLRLREAARKRPPGDLREPLLAGAGPGKKEEPAKKTDWSSTLKAIAKVARPDVHLFWLAMVFAVLAAVATTLVSTLTGDALDALIEELEGDDDDGGRAFRRFIVLLALVSAAGAVCTGCRGGLFSLIGVRINVRIRDLLFRHLLALELAYYDVTPTGDLNSRLASDTSKVGDQVSLNVNVFARTAVQLVTTLAFMLVASRPLTTVACCAVPVIGVATKRYGKLVWALSKSMQNELAGAMKVAEEAFSSMLTVRSMAAEPLVARDYAEALAKYRRVGTFQALAYSCWQSFNTALPNFMTCLLLFYGGRLAHKGEITSGKLVTFMLLTQSLSDSFNTLADMYSNIADALGAADKVFELLERKPSAEAPPAPLSGDPGAGGCAGDVSFEDVAFAYPCRPDTEVLKGVSFRAKPGQVVALVGPSGSGKSSCLALLQNFYAPARGRVLLDGASVAARPHAWLHARLAMVGQEPVLFARSIAKNVAYGLEGAADEEKISRCLAMANATSFVEALPDGTATEVGERGAALSGGQKQRIAIARALARDPSVLLLDEATSALDAESERCVQEALDALIKACNITVLVVAHRLSTIRDADKICVMKAGLLVESGTHDELFAADGVYADLVRRQTRIGREDSQSLLSAA